MLPDTDREAIGEAFEKGLAMFRAPVKDWPAFVEFFYDRDAIVMPPNSPEIRGHEAILAVLGSFPYFTEHFQAQTELEGLGDLAYSRDEFNWVPEIPGRERTKQFGKAICIWRRQADGSWKIFREIWNSDSAAG